MRNLRGGLTLQFFFNIYLFIWLCCVLVVARGIFVAECAIFSCGTWDLVPWPGIEPGPPALGARVLTTGPPGKSLKVLFQWLQMEFVFIFLFLTSFFENEFCCIHLLWRETLILENTAFVILIFFFFSVRGFLFAAL